MAGYTKVQQKLKSVYACPKAVEWVGTRSITKAWNECKVGAWMDWLATDLCYYNDNLLSEENCAKVAKALNSKNTRFLPADRIRAVVSAQVIARAFNKITID